MKKTLLFTLFIIILSNTTFAHELLKNDYDDNVYRYTVEEASKITKSGNPMDFVIAFKEDNDNKIFGELLNPLEFEQEDTKISDYDNEMIDKICNVRDIVNDNIRNKKIPQSQNISEIKNKNNKNKIFVIVTIICVILFVILFLFTQKKIFVALSVIVLIFGICSFVRMKQIMINTHDSISNYALTGEINNHLSKNINCQDNEEKLMEYMSQKWSIAECVNDYIEKVDYSKRYLNKFPKENERVDDSVLSFRYRSKDNLLFQDISLFKYNNGNKEEMPYKILVDKLYYKDIEKLYNYIIKDGIKPIDVFVKLIMDKINVNDIRKDEEIFKYIGRICDWGYLESDVDYYDNKVISYFKDWYIEGKEDKDIDLPYGVTLHYEAPKFVKKDIKEVLYTNESELDHNSKERQVYVMYYKDSKGELNGTYTDIEFVKTGNDYVVDFNPYELLYDLKKPVAILSIK